MRDAGSAPIAAVCTASNGYFTGEQALAYGLVDRVIERRAIAESRGGFGWIERVTATWSP